MNFTSDPSTEPTEYIEYTEQKEELNTEDIIDRWKKSDLSYKLYIFDFDKTLLKIHSWKDRHIYHPIQNRVEFKLNIGTPENDFNELDFLFEFFQAVTEKGYHLGIVSDQWTENILHYLSFAENSNGSKLLDFFISFDDPRHIDLPINLMGRSSTEKKVNRIQKIIDSINDKLDENLTLEDVIFYDDDINNICQLKQNEKCSSSGVWLAEGPFGKEILLNQIQKRLPLCLDDIQEQIKLNQNCLVSFKN